MYYRSLLYNNIISQYNIWRPEPRRGPDQLDIVPRGAGRRLRWMVGGGRAQYLEAYRHQQPSHGRPTTEKVTADSGSETPEGPGPSHTGPDTWHRVPTSASKSCIRIASEGL